MHLRMCTAWGISSVCVRLAWRLSRGRGLAPYSVCADDAQSYVKQLALRVPQHGDELMTIAEQLEQKGIEKGIEKGILIGEQRGVEKAALKIARELLQNGVEVGVVIKATGLSEDDLYQLNL